MKSIKDYTDIELKALAYDQLSNIEVSKANLKAINEELVSRQNAPVEPQNDTGSVPMAKDAVVDSKIEQ